MLGRVAALATAASAVLAGLAPTPASAAPPLGCGSVVTTNVTLSADITGCTGDGLVIGASNITIDLNGHRIVGAGTGSVTGIGEGEGISNPDGHDLVTVKNGRIEYFLFGVRHVDTQGSKVLGVTFNKVLYGAWLDRSEDSTVKSNSLIGLRDGDAGTGIRVSGGKSNVVYGNTLRDFRWYGIFVYEATSTEVAANTVSLGGFGVFVNGQKTTVRSNKIRWNQFHGILAQGAHYESDGSYSPGASGKIGANLVEHNQLHGISLTSAEMTVANNEANYNAGKGIEGYTGTTDGGGNRATGNGETPQCTYVVCS